MFKGGSNFNRTTAQIIRFVGLFIPIPLLIFGAFIQNNSVSNMQIIDTFSFFSFMFVWLVVELMQFLLPAKSNKLLFFYNLNTIIFVGFYLLLVTGIGSIISTIWIVFIISSYIIFGLKGSVANIIAFLIFTAIDMLFCHNQAINIINSAISTMIIIFGSLLTICFLHIQNLNQEKISKKASKDSLEHNRVLALVNNLTLPILSVDKKGIIRIYNAASLDLLDTNDSLEGRHIDDILPLTDDKNNDVSIYKQLKNLKMAIKRDDLEYNFSDGEKIRLEITCAPIRNTYDQTNKDEASSGYIVIFKDVTKEKSLEEERDEFISVTSHELRTPITIAEGTISNVQVMMDHPNATKKMLKDAVNVAHDQIIFLAHMVNDLSTLSRAERGISDAQESIDVKELAHMLHDKYVKEAEQKKLHLNLDLSPQLESVNVSRLYLEELLQNFITNALKYTQKGSVTIQFHQKNGMINFAVKDTGIGLSKTDQKKIFEKFYRSEDYRTRQTSGTGLGLYIAAKLAHKLKTSIQLDTRLNFGSTFSFDLPVEEKNSQEVILTK